MAAENAFKSRLTSSSETARRCVGALLTAIGRKIAA